MVCGDAPDPWEQSCMDLVLGAFVCAMRKSCLVNKRGQTLLPVQQNVIPSPCLSPTLRLQSPQSPQSVLKEFNSFQDKREDTHRLGALPFCSS